MREGVIAWTVTIVQVLGLHVSGQSVLAQGRRPGWVVVGCRAHTSSRGTRRSLSLALPANPSRHRLARSMRALFYSAP